jgi:ribosomal protein S12 methylthiotransferase
MRSPDYKGADAVIVNTCGFLDSAKAESLEAIGEALQENGRVIVTGCLGAEPDYITGAHPKVLAVTGPHQYEAVLDAVHGAVPPTRSVHRPSARHRRQPDPAPLQLSEDFRRLQPQVQVLHHPRHARPLVSRPAHAVLREAEKLVEAGVKELLVISQDTSPMGWTASMTCRPGRAARCAPISPTLRARWASSGPGCGCTTSTPTRMSAT